MEVGSGPGHISGAEYEDCHKGAGSVRYGLPKPASPTRSATPAVDEIPQKKYLLHMPARTFPQVRAASSHKVF
jgi:hypothetical protein